MPNGPLLDYPQAFGEQELKAPNAAGTLGASRPTSGTHCTISVAVVACSKDPDVPVIVMVNVPVGVPPGVCCPGAVTSSPPQAAWSVTTRSATAKARLSGRFLDASAANTTVASASPASPSQSHSGQRG